MGVGSLQPSHSLSVKASLLAQEEIDHPTAPNMLTRLATMVQDASIVTTSIFKGISENWHLYKSPLVVYPLTEFPDGPIVPGCQGTAERGRRERVSEDFTEESSLLNGFSLSFTGPRQSALPRHRVVPCCVPRFLVDWMFRI
jgi:hypothetical protein